MGVRFSAQVRRLIVAATTLAEARQAGRPRVRDLTDALASLRETVPPVSFDVLNDDLERVLGPASEFAGAEEVTLGMVLKALSGLTRQKRTRESDAGTSTSSLRRAEEPAPVARPGAGAATAHAIGRTGIGYDSHRFAPGGPMRLGGVAIESDVHCAGHSDGDAICHALTDAVLGAANAGDIGEMFPDTDPANQGRDSVEMLRAAIGRIRAAGLAVFHADVTVITERPKLAPHRRAICETLAAALAVDATMVSVKGKTNEGMGAIGRGEGLAVIAVATLMPAPR